MNNSSKFFENKACEYYPCHDMPVINCLFCYCPLYHLRDCPGIKAGVASYIDETTKDCSSCTITHHPTKAWKIVVQTLSRDVYKKDYTEKKLCINKCEADPTGQFCTGCKRTLTEITECGKQIKRETP